MNKMCFIKQNIPKVVAILVIGMLIFSCGKITAPADDKAPSTPANFSLFGAGDGQASFRWTPNGEEDFEKYAVYRAVDQSADFVKIAETTANEFIDQFLDYDRVYYYYLTSVDFAGNESNPTTIIDVRPINVSSPPPPINVSVFGHNYPALNQIEFAIKWSPPTVSDILKYFIYKSTEPAFAVSAENLIDSTDVSIYYDRTVKPGDVFYYRISTIDLGRREGVPSVANSDVILDKVLLESPANKIQFSSPFKFSWKQVDKALNYSVFISKSPLGDVLWQSPKSGDLSTFYQGPTLTSGALYYWWVSSYSKTNSVNDLGVTVEPDINSQSDIWTFFVR